MKFKTWNVSIPKESKTHVRIPWEMNGLITAEDLKATIWCQALAIEAQTRPSPCTVPALCEAFSQDLRPPAPLRGQHFAVLLQQPPLSQRDLSPCQCSGSWKVSRRNGNRTIGLSFSQIWIWREQTKGVSDLPRDNQNDQVIYNYLLFLPTSKRWPCFRSWSL